MSHFFKKMSKDTAIFFTGIITSTAYIYNNERTIHSNEKIAESQAQDNEALMLLLEQINNRLEKLENKLENNSQAIENKEILELKAVMNNSQFKENLMSAYRNAVKNPDKFKEDINTLISNLPKNQDSNTNLSNLVDNLDVSKSSLIDIDSILSVINEPGFISLSICIFLFSFVTVSSTFGLISNYYIDKFGDQYKNKVPKWLLPYFKIRKNLNNYSNKYYTTIILASQFMIMLLCVYMKFRGIA